MSRQQFVRVSCVEGEPSGIIQPSLGRKRVPMPATGNVAFTSSRSSKSLESLETWTRLKKMAGPGRRVIRESGKPEPEFLAGINDPIASLMPRGGHIRDDVHV